MLQHPQFDPVAIALGPLKIHWYGLTYLVGFAAGWWLGRLRSRKPWSPLQEEQVGDLLFYLALGVIFGGRFGYVVFYNFDAFVADPLWLLRIWEGGMSFHGGLLGVMLAMAWFGRKTGAGFWKIADFVAPLVPVGLGAGRIGNFINGELWGKPTDVAWGMVFPQAPDALARHPSQLYQFALEGVALFVILWWFSSRPRPKMAVSGLFLVCYGMFRFLVEFVRQPDPQLGYLAFDWLTMGQVLSTPMIAAGAALMFFAYRRNA
ncbi:prolipoprotein diacylglyceryl transferase [Marinobacter daepoensis]|uniref:Phosphatidylglycerol--prolipoprotein diacylglyceryl transferase n=1 Tax=Marinobacter daepoensis TaxID=262077 RepID=A0ABS3BIB3_9GAMM|nr:prolipoprotein diacylglyceryl transferase [Marinobacter daepoensis]MBN7771573.1 prolipoprotein diacylglyceryl transferase [Marinobacter daepoensis]MBY6034160.1 prolipoprotein diacylglyceryl transferase [Marinobacter daepoensis]MBY6080173.1 prolipoprotein diacylglyceryl transferase [Marinobacter daepoensis]